jgi:hypothetical protein
MVSNFTKINIAPGPRILRMLGQIDFKAWQCICEIIDNSIDSFSGVEGPNDSSRQHSIKVRLPSTTANSLKTGDVLEVEDNGAGMTIETLENSLRAGFSFNSPVDKMGLFGMGFNISTARLGSKTEIITATQDSEEILKVVIDFHQLEEAGSFDTMVERIPKEADEQNWHGTIVKITELKTEHFKPLFQKSRMVKKLGKIYGRVLRQKKIKISYQGVHCKPFQHCTWSAARTGQSKDGAVPAIIEIDHLIDKKSYCNTCWVWLSPKETECPACQNISSLTQRERRVTGWVGIQRYFHDSHYGIDLIRNGRVITELDKSFFYMVNANQDPELEYPVDGHQRLGRIVGELEIDFVSVTHQKDAFDQTTTDWRDVVNVVRGDSPIRPQIAKSLGFPPNTTPLATLFSAFRNAKAGVKNLVPSRPEGGAMLTHAKIDDLIFRFEDGETNYQSDDKWWELVTEQTGTLTRPPSENDPTGGNPFADDGPESEGAEPLDSIPTTDGLEPIEAEAILTDPDTTLSNLYELDFFKNITIRVIAEKSRGPLGDKNINVKLSGSEIKFTYWPDAPVFDRSLLRPADFLINELAYHMHRAAHNEVSIVTISEVELALREKYFPELHPTIDELLRNVRILSDELKNHLRNKQEGEIDVSEVDVVEIKKIRKRLAKNENLNATQVDDALHKGEFLSYASVSVMNSIVLTDPSLVFDGKFFKQEWNKFDLTKDDAVTDCDELKALLSDVEWFDENHEYRGGDLWRARARRLIGSLEVIASWRV